MIAAQTVASSTARPFAGRKVAATSNGSRVKMMAVAKKWMPGADTPAYLDNLPASYGFDPLGLGAEPASLKRFQEAEVIHCRWAMLGAAGCLAVEVLGQGDWVSAQVPITEGGRATYFGIENPLPLATVLSLNTVLMAGAESFRANAQGEQRIYPGGAFDPMGLSKGNLAELKVKEIKNGRLAMLAILGFSAQHFATGKSPLENLADHLANPLTVNFSTNGVSVPF